MIKDGIKAIKYFTTHGIKTNCTLVFSAGQAILAAKAGQPIFLPLLVEIDDTSWDGMELIAQLRSIFNMQGYKTEILAASIRNSLHIVKSSRNGGRYLHLPFGFYIIIIETSSNRYWLGKIY